MGSSPRKLSPAGQKIFLSAFCLVSGSIGLSLWIPGFLLPMLRWSAQRKWKETPCAITKAPFDGGGFGLEFRYEVDGSSYVSSEGGDVEFFSSPSPRSFELRSGAQTVCYVNPRTPGQAVLSRDLDPELFIWCAPLLFVILPLFALIAGLVRPARPPPGYVEPGSEPSKGSILLVPQSRRGCSILVLGVLVLMSGGIAALVVVIPGFREGLSVRLIYLTPIGLFLLVLLYSLGLTILRSVSPRLLLSVTPGQGAPGSNLEVRWNAPGGSGGVRRFHLLLEGREEVASSSKGSRSRSRAFATVEVFQGGPRDFKRGCGMLTIPVGTMHSLSHGSRRILWVFRLTAEMSGFPDILEEYPVQVLPKAGHDS
jgi:hypothetical protein